MFSRPNNETLTRDVRLSNISSGGRSIGIFPNEGFNKQQNSIKVAAALRWSPGSEIAGFSLKC